jgi:alpha-beta hydrolase superfamily lysophospholipase/thiol-disulfide isomerase/thioredoxin
MAAIVGGNNKFLKRARPAMVAMLAMSIGWSGAIAAVSADAVPQTIPGDVPSPVKLGAKVSVRTGGDIPCKSWIEPDRPPFAAFLCLHGFGMNMNSYEQFGQAMSELGIPTYAIDVRGFGCWQAAKGYNQLNFDDAISDVQETLKAIRRAHPGLPLVLIGESMGGALALQAMACDQTLADGLVCSVPADDRFGQRATDMKVAFAMLKGLHHKIPIGTRILRQITQDPKLRKSLENDPRDRIDFSPKELIQFQKFMNRTEEEGKRITDKPVLFLQGGGDRLVKPKGTKDVYAQVASKDKDLILIGPSEHLILEEGQFDGHVVSSLTSWVYRHVVIPKYPEGMFTAENTGLPPASFHKAIGHFRMGQGLLELGDQDGAREHLLQSIVYGKGTPIAPMANQLLAGLVKAPTVSSGTVAPDKLFVTHEEAMANDKPSVIFFGACWIDPSYSSNAVIERAASVYKSRVNFVRIDADDPNNKSIVEGYGVIVVPSIVFLDGANKIVGTELGSLSTQALVAELPKILNSSESDVAIEVPGELVAAKPSIVMFGSTKIAENKNIEIALNRLLEPYTGKVEFTELDSTDPKNAILLKDYRDRPLPVVLFLNSSHVVVSNTTGSASEEELAKSVASITAEKQLPLQAKAN